MGIIASSELDGFFSYAHDDNETTAHWIHSFFQRLERRLPAELRADVLPGVREEELKLCIDKNGLAANGVVEKRLEELASSAELLFVFAGSAYPRSQYCGKEFEAFTRTPCRSRG